MSATAGQSDQKERWIIGGAIGVIAVLTLIGCVATSSGGNDPHHDLESIAQCETRISKLLKSPATADFNSSTTASGEDSWTVTGTVDSENSFGASVRSTYQCTVVMNETQRTATTTVDYLRE